MRFSQAYIPTRKEIPSDAVIPSHQLMLRAGLIQQLAAGVYSHLPFGWRVMKQVMEIIREEMDRIGAQELLLPALNPIEIWDETDRNADFGDEMFRLYDRKKRQMALAPTHEEIICDLARKFVKSYKDMPQMWYQIQNKFRDEPRPRSGVVRTRQFIMKDSYSIDINDDALNTSYDLHAQAYHTIFKRCGLVYYVVGASSGLMGGSGSQEFMVESKHGEDSLALCQDCDYAANVEIADSVPEKVISEPGTLEKVHTPGQRTIDEVSGFLKRSPAQLMKSLVYMAQEKPHLVLVRGDHEVNETKLQSLLGADVRPAHPDEVKTFFNAEVGYIGPLKIEDSIEVLADNTLKGQHDLATGANENDYHWTGIEMDRDIRQVRFEDIREVKAGEKCVNCGGTLRLINAIELGHIFKLGRKYSEKMKATYLDQNGKSHPITMGSYGIGVERIIAALVEQNHDEHGLVWDWHLTPYHIHLMPLNVGDEAITSKANEIYDKLTHQGYDVLIDDRKASPGYKFKEADLLGLPMQIIIGKNYKSDGKLEVKFRKSQEKFLIEENDIEHYIAQCQHQSQ